MVDHPTVCCMCGDVGFPDKLFLCKKCRSRSQHSYCSNYYDESFEATVCDWCRSEERNGRQMPISKKSTGKYGRAINHRSDFSGDRIKENDGGESSDRGKNTSSGAPSQRPAGRRYKLLKDVLC